MSEVATFSGGCFWCTEAVFKRLKGVISIIPGYTGGTLPQPTYDQVCSGKTGHAEAIQITFNPDVITFTTLLEVFWKLHDPTTLNQQGNDVGTQYRSAIFYHNDEQKKIAEKSKKEIEESGYYKNKVVTEIVPFTVFYEAEAYHHNYYDKNKQYPYCHYNIDPKIQKLFKEFGDKVKPSI